MKKYRKYLNVINELSGSVYRNAMLSKLYLIFKKKIILKCRNVSHDLTMINAIHNE